MTQPDSHLRALLATDPDIAQLISREADDQRDQLRLIASENYVSQAVIEATASVLMNKYAEGYPKKRYYEGQVHIDQVESLAITRAQSLFGAEFANVQPLSGSPANLAAYTAVMEPGETLLGMALPAGGHLTHGWKVSATGKFWNVVQYGVDRDTHLIDFDEVRRLAHAHRPKVIVAGASAYPRLLDFATFRAIADEVDALLMVDMAHIAGLVAGGAHPSPFPYADIVTTTTHKTLRGPRGAILFGKKKHRRALRRAVFPGLQGGPHMHTIAAIAVALREAQQPEFTDYAQQICANAKQLSNALIGHGFKITTGGTDNHLMVVDVTARDLGGQEVATALSRAGIIVNMNAIPFDTRPPSDPSGIRIGTAALTTRGFGLKDMEKVADWIDAVVRHIKNETRLDEISREVRDFCRQFPAPGISHTP